MEVLPSHIDRDTNRYSGLLQMRVTAALEDLRRADRATFDEKRAAYKARCEDLLAYIAVSLSDPRVTNEAKKNLRSRRALILPEMLKNDRKFSSFKFFTTRTGIKLRDFASRHPVLIAGLQYVIATGIAPFLAAGIRALVVGTAIGTGAATAGVVAFLTSWALGQRMKQWKDAKVEDADVALNEAYESYTEDNRNESMARIARALAVKRKSELKRTMRRLGLRILAGGFVGGITGAFIQEVTAANAGTIHKPNGAVEGVQLTEANIYHHIFNRGGFFAVKNSDGTYNIFFYDRARGTVELSIGGARTLREMSEYGALELSPSDVTKLSRNDQMTIWYASSPTVRDILSYTNAASEKEMEGLYTLSPLPSDKDLPPSYWREVMADMKRFGDGKFFIGDRPATDAEVHALYTVLFSRINIDTNTGGEPWTDPATGLEVRTRATFSIEENENGELRPVTREDPSFKDLAPWAQVSVRAHEMGHLLHSILNIDSVFNDLPAAEREKIMSELFEFYKKLTEMGVKGRASGYKGWTEEMRQLAFVSRNPKDYELFAEFIGKMMTHPEEMRKNCPHFYKFMKELINSHPELSKVMVVH
jgi:hypothetical protein